MIAAVVASQMPHKRRGQPVIKPADPFRAYMAFAMSFRLTGGSFLYTSCTVQKLINYYHTQAIVLANKLVELSGIEPLTSTLPECTEHGDFALPVMGLATQDTTDRRVG